MAGKFPVGGLPEPKSLLEEDYQKIIAVMEAERVRLGKENEFTRRDAEEYYTLWAHQIKTPIAAARLLLQSRRGGISPEARSDIEQEIFRIGQYVDMVLQYQRLSSIGNDLAPDKFDIAYLVRQAAKNCAPLFIHKGLALETGRLEGNAVTDKKWFCFVLEQLFTNAVKYTDNGVIKVYVREGQELVVEDSGSGIPAGDLPRVFERGFTGAAGRTERSSTGIGLYLCKQVLKKLGFGISIESTVGKGTKAVIRFAQKEIEIY
jgi:signal transduction histidine kinase